MKKNKRTGLKKLKGQISIFLALIFLILFSLFGMTISMGMFVHDKINLQNSTDLASYYVASKQAELLGAIAHSNYQIRQSWKLLAFRYRVIGNAARTENGQISPGVEPNWASSIGDHSVYRPASFDNGKPPRVCIAATHVFKETSGDNLCKIIDFSVSYIPRVPQTISIAIIGQTNSTIDATNLKIENTCNASAFSNWWYANTIVGAHKLEQRDRRAVIEALARNLAQPIAPGGMKDLDGNDVYEGARKTFEYNLTESNRERADFDIQFENSLQGLEPADWLAPIHINTIVPWSFFENNVNGGCAESVYPHVNEDQVASIFSSGIGAQDAREARQILDPDERLQFFGSLSASSSEPLENMSVGVEKNPWVMVYNKATGRAVSKPLFLFDVFGDGINMQALAYAKPFGGRIGPWYNKNWPQGSPTSSGGGKTDELLPDRVDAGQLGAVDGASAEDPTLFPNYSRHPGDEDGMSTRASQVFAGRLINWPTNLPGGREDQVDSRIADYQHTTYSYYNGNPNDPLAQNSAGSSPWDSFNRNLEIAAVRPDAFDVTHYSISPTFFDYYVRDKLATWLSLPSDVELRGDLGFHRDGPAGVNDFDILNQMELGTVNGIDRSARAGWVRTINRAGALLSSWIPGVEVMDYGPADQGGISNRFANCATLVPNGRIQTASQCLNGGRTGYSVKMISKKYLEGDHPIGGGGSSGQITNPL